MIRAFCKIHLVGEQKSLYRLILVFSMKKSLVFLCFFLFAMHANADDKWMYKQATHVAMGESVESFFSDLGASADVLIRMSEDVLNQRELVTVTYTDKKIIDIVNDITNAYGLIWYYDGQTLYIYSADELVEKKVELYKQSFSELVSSLKAYGFYDGRYVLRSNAKGNVAYFSAPPRYAQIIEQVAEDVNNSARDGDRAPRSFVFRAFPLKYATAYDRTLEYDGKDMEIEGVATLLAQAMGLTTRANRNNRNVQQADLQQAAADARGSSKDSAVTRMPKNNVVERYEAATITADKKTNAVIIYDLIEKMPMYETFIAELDKATEQIEISVSIIDVQSDQLTEIGLDWAANGTDFDLGFGQVAPIQGTTANTGYIGVGNYQNATTLLASQVKTLMGTIKAIKDENGAKILSKPAVVTQDNFEAIIDHISTFYVRLEGQEDVDLIPISSGSVLRVVPRLIGIPLLDQMQEIQLSVSIKDGSISSTEEVDSIPVVNSSTIKTQAVVSNGESLLVGGFYYDSEQDDVRKIPVLGDIPVIKTLFRHTKTRKVQLSRLFLITPRIVGKKLNQMQRDRVLDTIQDVQRGKQKDHLFNSIIMD